MRDKRKILLVTGSRADYSHTRRIVKLIGERQDLTCHVVATDMHLLPEYGTTVHELERDGVRSSERILMTLAGYSHESMAKSLGVFHLSFVDVLVRERPDVLLLVGDRGDQLMAAIAASYMYVPTAHIQGGDVSGNIDGMVRHAITKFSHIHLAGTAAAAERLRRLGEEEFRIHVVGSPQLDELIEQPALTREQVLSHYRVKPQTPFVLVVQHPVTEQARFSGEQMVQTLEAIGELGYHAVIVYPNDDAGSLEVQRAIEEGRSAKMHAERNLGRETFAGLLRSVDAIVGNSSAGIIEAPSLELPAVNIGIRQEGRFQAPNVINSGHSKDEIKKAVVRAVNPEFRASLKGLSNPYGDGDSSARIVDLLANIDLDEKLRIKRMTY